MTLHVHAVALDMIRALRPLLGRVARHDRSLADQLRRAASSVVLNLAEMERSDAGNARARLCTAAGSLSETRAALRLVSAWGYLDDGAYADADALADRVSAMLYRLSHPRRGF